MRYRVAIDPLFRSRRDSDSIWRKRAMRMADIVMAANYPSRTNRPSSVGEFIAKRSLHAEITPSICRNKQPGQTERTCARHWWPRSAHPDRPAGEAGGSSDLIAFLVSPLTPRRLRYGRGIRHRRHRSGSLAGLVIKPIGSIFWVVAHVVSICSDGGPENMR
jgi:hypothetical protein